MKQPNIFLILAEDICPNLGCYGDLNAKTPRLDAFAEDNIKFNYCYSAAPVCSAARSSLNLGMFGSTAGVGQHRSMNQLPDHIKNIGQLMQEAGYFTAIGKTDFNYPLHGGYDVHMKFGTQDTPEFAARMVEVIHQKPDNQPLFVIQTNAITHQSQYGYTQDTDAHRKTMPRLQPEDTQDRQAVQVPGYHFDSTEAREVWAQYHEKLTAFDRMFGETIDRLKEVGMYDDSVIIFVGDNGHGIPEGKINLWNEGVHVPMLMHVPKAMEDQLNLATDQYGRYCERLVSFVDFAPTMLALAGAKIPEHMQGKAFLGDQRTPDPSEVYSFGERVDEVFENSRSIHEKDVMYMCDFAWSPYRRLNTYQIQQAPWFVRSMIEKGYENSISDVDRRALFREIPRVSEQLFDLKDDKNQLENLAEKEEHKEQVVCLRNKMFTYIETMRDDALMAEPLCKELMKATGLTAYEILQDDKLYPITRLIKLWESGIEGKPMDGEVCNPCEKMIVTKFLADRGENKEKLIAFSKDESETVSAYAAYQLGDIKRLEGICEATDNFVLLMFIVDLLAAWRDQRAEGCLKIITERHCVNGAFVIADRYLPAMRSALNMLCVRIQSSYLEDKGVDQCWNHEKYAHSYMVMNALDLEQTN